jgi:hypothetical protein
MKKEKLWSQYTSEGVMYISLIKITPGHAK